MGEKLNRIWKKLNETTFRQLVEQTPPETFGMVAAVVLAAMAALPLFVSATFRMPAEYLEGVIDLQYAGVLYSYVLGSYWFRCLLILGVFTGFLTVYGFAKMRWREHIQGDSGWNWIRARWLPVCLSLMLLWSVLSALLSGNLKICFLGEQYRQEGVLTYVLYAMIFSTALLLTRRQMRMVCEVLVAVCAGTGVLVITGGELFPGLFYLEEDLRAAMFHQYNHYGYFLAICFPLCVGLILQEERPGLLRMLLRLGQYWLICNAVAFNSVRGSFIAIVAALVGWNIVVLWNHRSKWKQLLLLDLIFAATIVWLNTGSTLLSRMGVLFNQLEKVQQAIPAATEAAKQQAAQVPSAGTASAAMDKVGSERGLLWRLGIQFALEKPLFGYGPDNLGHLYSAYRADLADRPHNELIQFAASLGFPALSFYVAGIGGHVASFFRSAKKLSLFEVGLFASVGSYLVSSLFGNTMYYTTPYFYMMLAFSYCAAKKASEI